MGQKKLNFFSLILKNHKEEKSSSMKRFDKQEEVR